MTRYTRRLALFAAVSLVGLLAVGAATASACGPGGGKGGASTSALVTEAAKQLNVTRARLKTAIQDSANAYIDSEVTSGDVTAADAADLRTRVEDNLDFAYRTSQTKTVASNLGITVAALNSGFQAARKALITAQIDKALANGTITAAKAGALKSDLDDAVLPGYTAVGSGGFDLGKAAKDAAGAQQQQHRAFRR